jgi:hypothetical protein
VALFSGPFGVTVKLFARVLAGLMVVYFLPKSKSDMVLTNFASQWLPPVCVLIRAFTNLFGNNSEMQGLLQWEWFEPYLISEYAVENLAKLLAYLDATLSFSSVSDNSCKKSF